MHINDWFTWKCFRTRKVILRSRSRFLRRFRSHLNQSLIKVKSELSLFNRLKVPCAFRAFCIIRVHYGKKDYSTFENFNRESWLVRALPLKNKKSQIRYFETWVSNIARGQGNASFPRPLIKKMWGGQVYLYHLMKNRRFPPHHEAYWCEEKKKTWLAHTVRKNSFGWLK